MTSSHFIQWIKHPETLDRESLYELRTLITRYPYFHSLRLLYLKNLYLLHDTSFGEELRKSALFVADRSVLFYHIEGARYALQPQKSQMSSSQTAENQEGKDRTLFLIDSFLQSVPDEQPQHTELDYSVDYTAYLLTADPDMEEFSDTDNVPRLRGQNLIDDFLSKSDTPLDTELPLTDGLPEYDLATIQSDEENSGTEEAGENQGMTAQTLELSEATAYIEPAVQTEKENFSEKENMEWVESEEDKETAVEIPLEDETFTETLAKIYVKQHRYDKALEIIKKLSLNYPKKNAYFADQIRFLEKLIINAKSK